MTPFAHSPTWLAAGWTMFHFLWIGALIGTIAAAVRSALARGTPSVRYATALGLLVATAALPGCLFFWAMDAVREQQFALAQTARGGWQPSINIRQEPLTWPDRTWSPWPGEHSRDSPSDRSSRSLPPDILTSLCRWLPWLWISGTPAVLLLLTCGAIGVDRLRRDSRPIEEGEVAALCRRMQAALGVDGRVVVAFSDRVAAPLLVGVVRPTILLPSAILTGCSPDQLEMILIHELAHVRRWDNLVNLGQRLIEAALFFHPVIWWLSRWVRLEREQCCDRIVLAHTGEPQVYAETLAAFAMPGIAFSPAAVSMTDSHLTIRIRHILDLEEETMSLSRKALLIATAVVVIGVGLTTGWFAIQERAAARLAERVREIPALAENPRAANGPYRVASPDVLAIEVASKLVRNSLQVGDEIVIRATNLLPIDPMGDPDLNSFKRVSGPYQVQPDGTVDLGPEYGSVVVEGKSISEARDAIVKHFRSEKVGLVDPKVSVSMPIVAAKPAITGEHKILPDGTVWLGSYGSVRLGGLTLEEVKAALEKHLQKFVPKPEVRIDVIAFHSQ